MSKSIDQSKKSNKRCCNCGHYAEWPREKCLVTGADKNYWNCCASFVWQENKQYINVEVEQDG